MLGGHNPDNGGIIFGSSCPTASKISIFSSIPYTLSNPLSFVFSGSSMPSIIAPPSVFAMATMVSIIFATTLSSERRLNSIVWFSAGISRISFMKSLGAFGIITPTSLSQTTQCPCCQLSLPQPSYAPRQQTADTQYRETALSIPHSPRRLTPLQALSNPALSLPLERKPVQDKDVVHHNPYQEARS